MRLVNRGRGAVGQLRSQPKAAEQKLAFGQPVRAKFNQVPRLKGRFLWSQAAALKRAGAEMLYVAMFDEVDEATAIFKVTNDPPVNGARGERFISYGDNGEPDHYLWLSGEIRKMLNGVTPPRERMPVRQTGTR